MDESRQTSGRNRFYKVPGFKKPPTALAFGLYLGSGRRLRWPCLQLRSGVKPIRTGAFTPEPLEGLGVRTRLSGPGMGAGEGREKGEKGGRGGKERERRGCCASLHLTLSQEQQSVMQIVTPPPA